VSDDHYPLWVRLLVLALLGSASWALVWLMWLWLT
jgi:hypothetical protein